MKLFETILVVACIFIALYNFDLYNLNRTIVSILLLLTAAMTLVRNEKLRERIRNAAVFLTFFLIAKLLIAG